MLMLPMYFGEEATITTLTGEVVTIFLSNHRSSRDEPIIGFGAPPGFRVRRQRMQTYFEAFLQQVQIFQISCVGEEDLFIVAAREAQAWRRYRKRYPDRESFEIRVIEDTEERPLASYPWYEQLQRLHDCQTRVPFFIE